jgi:hypothetical protein
MGKFLSSLAVCACLVVPAPARAGDRRTIKTTEGSLAIVGDEVVVTKDFEVDEGVVHDVWSLEATDEGRASYYIRGGVGGRYLTANEEGQVYLTKKPEKGSLWGVQVPHGKKANTGIDNLAWEGGLRVDKEGTAQDAKGKERKVHRLKLTPPPGRKPPAERSSTFTVSAPISG